MTTFFRVMGVVQLFGCASTLLSPLLDAALMPALMFAAIIAVLSCAVLATGWAAAARSQGAIGAAALLLASVALRPVMSPPLIPMVMHAVATVMLVVSLAPHVRGGWAVAAWPVAGVGLMLAELVDAYTLAGVGDTLHHAGLALVAFMVREGPRSRPVDWEAAARGAKRVSLAEGVRLWLIAASFALALLAFIIRGIPHLVVVLMIANLAALVIATIGALELAAARGPGAAWAGAALGLGALGVVLGVVELLDPQITWAPLARVVCHNGLAASVALSIGTLLHSTSPTQRRGDARRCAVTYVTVLMLAAVQVIALSSPGLWPVALVIGLGLVIVFVIAASTLRRLAADVPIAARDRKLSETFGEG